jgi:transcription antitermination factor NusG
MERWYVIRSKPQKEQFLWEQLVSRNLNADLPQIRVKPVNPRAKKARPFFPGYLFIKMDIDKVGCSPFRSIPGSCGLVMFGGEAACITDAVWFEIHQHLAEINNRHVAAEREAKKGAPVWIREGPLAGYQAIFDMRLPDTERVRVLIRLMRDQQIRVELPAGQLEFAEYSYR